MVTDLAPDGHRWCPWCACTGYDASYKGRVMPCEACDREAPEPPQGWDLGPDMQHEYLHDELPIPTGEGHDYGVMSLHHAWLPTKERDYWDSDREHGVGIFHEGPRRYDRDLEPFDDRHPILGHYPVCSCSWVAPPQEDERQAWVMALDHVGVPWRDQAPVKEFDADNKKQVKALESLIPDDYEGPITMVFSPCVQRGELDRATGQKTRHMCRGIVPNQRGVFNTRGRICVCECHSAADYRDRLYRCSFKGCVALATTDAMWCTKHEDKNNRVHDKPSAPIEQTALF